MPRAIALALVLALGACSTTPPPSLQADAPSRETARSAAFADLAPWIEESHSPAGMIVHDGRTVFSWGDVTKKMWIHSCRKSLLSALVGNAVTRGEIDLGTTLDKLGMDDVPPSLTADEKQATVLDLLEARSGIYHLAASETPSMKDKRPARGSHPHGTYWYYNNWDFNALGAIYEKATKTSIFDAFDREIARPLGMQDYSPADGHYERTEASQYPSYLFMMSTRDLARFGQLYLQQGRWEGKDLVPASWIRQSVVAYSEAGPKLGYGYLFWTSDDGTGLFRDVSLGQGAFAAEGYGGHYVIVAPEHRLVVVVRADDAWYEADTKTHNIGPQRTGDLLRRTLRDLDQPSHTPR